MSWKEVLTRVIVFVVLSILLGLIFNQEQEKQQKIKEQSESTKMTSK